MALFTASLASLGNLVGLIVLMGAEEEVRRIAAPRIIAAMANAKPLGDCANVVFEAHPVSLVAATINRDSTVTPSIKRALPGPAVVNGSPFDPQPKACDYFFVHWK